MQVNAEDVIQSLQMQIGEMAGRIAVTEARLAEAERKSAEERSEQKEA